MDGCFDFIKTTYSNAEQFLEPTKVIEDGLIESTKKLYDFMQDVDLNYIGKTEYFDKLLTVGFDNEQIWQELELQNKYLLKHMNVKLNELQKKQKPFRSGSDNENHNLKTDNKNEDLHENSEVSSDNNSESDASSEEDNEATILNSGKNIPNNIEEDEQLSENEIENRDSQRSDTFGSLESIKQDNNQNINKNYKKTEVDDEFFRLREMEDFLDSEDRKEEQGINNDGIDDDIDLFAAESEDDGDDVGDNDYNYEDFFDPPSNSKRSSSNQTQDNDETIDEDFEINENDENLKSKNLSTFERKQTEMQQKIQRLEDENISEKPWQLLGETSGRVRPINSLLEEHVTFDHTSVGAPEITEETTKSLEDIIKQRIKDQAWDDVERKVKAVKQAYEYKKAPELMQEKSKLSLAEVYEKEYLKEQQTEKIEKENEDHVTINKMMDKLFTKLDALSNFHYTPKPPKPELKVISNLPSLQMEEITPITMTDASQLAPEEIYDKKRGDVKGDSEKSSTDRKHERRQKKMKKKFAKKEKESKEKIKQQNGGKVIKSSKQKALQQLQKSTHATIVDAKKSNKVVKSSSEFFSQLQDAAKQTIENKKSDTVNKGKMKAKRTAHSLKL